MPQSERRYVLVKLANAAGSKGVVIENNAELWRGFKPFIGFDYSDSVRVLTPGKPLEVGRFKPDNEQDPFPLLLPGKGVWRFLPNSKQLGYLYPGVGFAPKGLPADGIALVTYDEDSPAIRVHVTQGLYDLGGFLVIGNYYSEPAAATHLQMDFCCPGTIILPEDSKCQAVCITKPGIYVVYKDIWAIEPVSRQSEDE